MQRTNVVKLLNSSHSDDLSDVMILCAVSSCFEEEFSCKRDLTDGKWYLDVRASSIDELISVLCLCKRTMLTLGGGTTKAEARRG